VRVKFQVLPPIAAGGSPLALKLIIFTFYPIPGLSALIGDFQTTLPAFII
jgi:hypothetical protein